LIASSAVISPRDAPMHPFHRGTSTFDRSMILLNEIVNLLITSHLNILPLRLLAPQKPKGHMALQVAIERDLARPSR
jgi:hypothetical protein